MKKPSHAQLVERLTHLGPAIVTLSLALWCILLVGREEVSQKYPLQQLEKAATQAKVLRSSVSQFLSAGVPLSQFAGFSRMAPRLIAENPHIVSIRIFNKQGEVLFSHGREASMPAASRHGTSRTDGASEGEVDFSLSQDEAFYIVDMPLHNKFENTGRLLLMISKERVNAPAEARFEQMALMFTCLVVVFALVLLWLGDPGRRRKRVLAIGFFAFLFLGIGLASRQLEGLYRDATASRLNAVSRMIAGRLEGALSLGLSLDDFTGLDRELATVQQADAGIEQIQCVRDTTIVLSPDAAMVGRVFTSASRRGSQMTPIAGSAGMEVAVSVVDAYLKPGYSLTRIFWPLLWIVLCAGALLFFLDYYLAKGFQTLKVPATVVLSLVFVLLYYVGLGEAYRGFPLLHLEKMKAQGDAVRLAMEGFLQSGVPLRQFGGFKTLAQPLLSSDPLINKIQVLDAADTLVFAESGGEKESERALLRHSDAFSTLEVASRHAEDYVFSESQGFYRVSIPLRDKFEVVGSLELTVYRAKILTQIDTAFSRVVIVMATLILLFVAVLFIGDRYSNRFTPLLYAGYAVSFLAAAGFVVATLTQLYTAGIQAKTMALSASLAKRLEAATTLGLPLSDFRGVAETLAEYKTNNPELSGIALVKGETVQEHTDTDKTNQQYLADPRAFTHTSPLAGTAGSSSDMAVSLSIPREVVRSRLWRAIKNFIVLFVATALLAALFLNLIALLGRQKALKRQAGAPADGDLELALVKILFFMVVFVEGLYAAFLPLYLQDLAEASLQKAGSASMLFTAYFAAFALSLIPSGTYSERQGIKPLMIWGVLFTALSAYGMTLVTDYYTVMLLRILAGVSQGMIFIGVQAFVLQVTSRGKTTQGTSVIVYGYNTGMISGTAIGALLVLYLGSQTVFRIGAAISLFIFAFILFLIPEVGKKASSGSRGTPVAAFVAWMKKLKVTVRDPQFLNTIVLVGMTTKATMTGIIVYGLPLIMSRLGYPQDDIGQILMFYAAGVLLTNVYIPRLADKMGATGPILARGSICSGLGLILMSLIGTSWIPEGLLRTAMLTFGVFILGISHGFIHAPIVTHIAHTRTAGVLGKAATTSLYRFLERIGHVLGPIIVGHLLMVTSYSPTSFGYIGIALAACGILFLLIRLTGPTQDPASAVGEAP